MNNKGFTLIELLAVLVILITILSIAIPSITSAIGRNKESMLNEKYEIIEAQAEMYADSYKNTFNYTNFKNGSCCINITSIKAKGLLNTSDLKDADNKTITGYVCYVNNEYKYTSSGVDC